MAHYLLLYLAELFVDSDAQFPLRLDARYVQACIFFPIATVPRSHMCGEKSNESFYMQTMSPAVKDTEEHP
jgi:hypothetical protein